MTPLARALAAFALVASPALAQEDEFQDKIAEDLKAYEAPLKTACGLAKVELKWVGKLGRNPREGEGNSLSSLCTSGLAGVVSACAEPAVKGGLEKVEVILCRKGKGTLAYKLAGKALSLLVDGSFTKSNAPAQQTALEAKLKQDLAK